MATFTFHRDADNTINWRSELPRLIAARSKGDGVAVDTDDKRTVDAEIARRCHLLGDKQELDFSRAFDELVKRAHEEPLSEEAGLFAASIAGVLAMINHPARRS
jgi:hypothetical protein